MSEWTSPAQPVRCIVDLSAPLAVRRERGLLVQGDDKANAIVAEVYQKSGAPYDLAGSTVILTFVRPDGYAAEPITAEVSENVAIATLSDVCYRVSGTYVASLRLKKNGHERTIVRIVGEIVSTENNGTVSDEQILPTPEELLEMLTEVEQARDNANAAASAATTAATKANTATTTAQNAANAANTAAQRAENAAQNWESGTAQNANKLGGKPPKYYNRPRNLLVNSYFRNVVNQRAANGTFTAWGGYTIDRWAAFANGATIGVTDDGLSLRGAIFQDISAKDMSRFNGKWLTFAVKINGVVYVACGIFEQTDNWHMIARTDTPYGYINIEAQNDNKLFCVIDSTTTTTTVEWAALYEGEYTVETVPQYVPKGYVAELMACRRYYYRVDFSWKGLAVITRRSSTSFRGAIILPVPMSDTGGRCSISNLNAIVGTVMVTESGNHVISNISYSASDDVIFLTVVLAEATDEKAGIIYGGSNNCFFDISTEF